MVNEVGPGIGGMPGGSDGLSDALRASGSDISRTLSDADAYREDIFSLITDKINSLDISLDDLYEMKSLLETTLKAGENRSKAYQKAWKECFIALSDFIPELSELECDDLFFLKKSDLKSLLQELNDIIKDHKDSFSDYYSDDEY